MENTSKINVFEKTAVFLFVCFFEEGVNICLHQKSVFVKEILTPK